MAEAQGMAHAHELQAGSGVQVTQQAPVGLMRYGRSPMAAGRAAPRHHLLHTNARPIGIWVIVIIVVIMTMTAVAA